MHRIDSSGAIAGLYTPGNPATGQRATMIDADALNAIQEELCSVIEAAGLDLEKGTNNQLLQALEMLLLKPGMIMLWSGSVGSIPAGWALCNGSNGTPNMRDRFIVGAGGAYAVGATGGAATHGHTATAAAASTGITINTTTANVNGDGDPPAALTSATPNDPQHAHTVTVDNGDSRPPYYALAYIMKL